MSQSPQSRVNDFHKSDQQNQVILTILSQSPQSRVNDFHG
ncbi:Uncharacterized protein dnl_19100 [Desulfonema limicola]|uniref:Uncharacterized protein n=1 Tax=Desulfonema limicola TaxID=45656 RepID=A0A975GFX4_9BACT|nr:Uncharacterized protein dnl_19100 [Desulfonema limicola]